MRLFKHSDLMGLLLDLKSLQCNCALLAQEKGGGTIAPKDLWDEATGLISDAADFAGNAGLEGTRIKATLIKRHLNHIGSSDVSSLETELRNTQEQLVGELWQQKFFRVRADRTSFIDNENLLGVAALASFPSAKSDILEAGNCMAAERNTAAVFHLMRAVEWGIRAFCVHMGFRKLKSRIKKTGEVVYTPIEYSQWENTLHELQGRVDRKIGEIRRGPQKQKDQEFYYPALQELRAIRDAWRNHLMHTRATYNREDAMAILSHVQRLMCMLATRVSEV
jgi:hypothetical protein